MRDSKLSRRDMLRASTVLAAGTVFAEPLAAVAPEPTPLGPALIQAARKEGTLAFYTAMEIPLAEGLSKAFEAKYPGIKVRLKRSGAERVFERIGKEEEIRIHEVDVACSTDAGHFVRWRREGLLEPFLPEDAAKYLSPEQIGADGMYATAFASLSPIGYNTNLVKPEDAPTTFADLLDPRWQGKIVKGNPNYSGTVFAATFALSRDLGWSYFERLAQQKVVQVESSRDPPNRLARGESAVQADGAHSQLLLLRERGAPVEIVYAGEGTPLIIAPSAVFKTAPSPNAARLFQSFVFSIEAQQGLVKSDPEAMEAQREDVKGAVPQHFRRLTNYASRPCLWEQWERAMATEKPAKGGLEHLRVIVYQEGGMYVAQCLEKDIVTQAPDIPTLLERLDLTIDAECAMSRENGEELFAQIAPAPNYFRDLWDKRSVTLKHSRVPVYQHLEIGVALAA